MNRRSSCLLALVSGIALVGSGAHAAEPSATATTEQHAAQLARAALAEYLKSPAASLEVANISAATWNDSNLGCPHPGQSAAMVITSGHEVTLKSGTRMYRVHVSGERAVICEPQLPARAPAARAGFSARGLDAAIERAKTDLAGKLHVESETVKVIGLKEQAWPDRQLGCSEPQQDFTAGNVKGYRIVMSVRGRTYSYHTDLQQTLACPPIEAE